MAKVFNISDAKTHLSRLVRLAGQGEDIIIAKAGVPKVRLVPIPESPPVRRPGRFAGSLTVDSSFFDPLDDDELSAWEG